MFEGLTENLSKALRNLRGLGKLTDENMAEALDEVRKALLSADVHFKVAREFTEKVKSPVRRAGGNKIHYPRSTGDKNYRRRA